MRSERLGLVAGIVALNALVLWTYLPTARLWPWGTDAERWLERGDPSRAGFAEWVFHTRHFVGYRPVAALSFAADALWIAHPPDSHWIDFAAMGVVLTAVVLLARSLVRPWSSPIRASACGLFAGLLVALHPVMQEILPYVPRRSYELAEGFGLLGMLCFVEGTRRAPATGLLRGWSVPATLAFGLACGSNEAIFPLLLLLPAFGVEAAIAAGMPWRSGLRSAAAPLLPALALVWKRNFVLTDSNLTGYAKKWFAYADGHNRLRVLEAPEPWSVFSAAWSYVFFPSSPTGDPPLFGGWLVVFLVAVASWWIGRVVLDPMAGWGQRARRLPLWLAAWGVATAVLYALANTWFWREGFPLLIPVAISLAAIASVDLEPRQPRTRRALTGAALGAIALSMLWWSPLFGLDLGPLTEETRATRALGAVRANADRLGRPSVVWMVAQGDADFAHDLARAANQQTRGSGISFRTLGWSPRSGGTPNHGTAHLAEGAVVLPPGAKFDPPVSRLTHVPRDASRVALTALSTAVPVKGEVWWWEGKEMLTLRTAALPPAATPGKP